VAYNTRQSIIARKKEREREWKSRMQKKFGLKLYKNYKKNIKELLYALPVYFIKISQAGPSARSQFFSGRA